MFFHNNVMRALYILPLAAQIAVLWAVAHRRLQRHLPFFAIFLVYKTIEVLCAFTLYEFANYGTDTLKLQWFYVSWYLEVGAHVLVLCFLIEIMHDSLAQYGSIRRKAAKFLAVAGVIAIVVAIGSTPFANADYPVTRMVNVAVRSARLFELGMVVAFFILARYLALSFRNYQFGILLGFGLFAASDLACAALVAQYGGIVGYKVMEITGVSEIAMLVLWFYYILKREPNAPSGSPGMGGDDLDAWKKTLDDMN
jgi:hypothetical protein